MPLNEKLSPERFIQDFPEFEGTPLVEIQRRITRAEVYISPALQTLDEWDALLAVELMTAHILTLDTQSDGNNGILQSSSIKDVSISMMTPPTKGMFDYLMSQTEYGKQLVLLIETRTIPYQFVGGRFTRVL